MVVFFIPSSTLTVSRSTYFVIGPVSATAARLAVEGTTQLVIDAPLHGKRFIAGDGCCDSTRHVRASLPLNGQEFDSQRFAIDWEQLDAGSRIYDGADSKDPNSYVIYGQPAYAVADARVIAAVDGLPNSPIGSFPAGLPLDQADANTACWSMRDKSCTVDNCWERWA